MSSLVHENLRAILHKVEACFYHAINLLKERLPERAAEILEELRSGPYDPDEPFPAILHAIDLTRAALRDLVDPGSHEHLVWRDALGGARLDRPPHIADPLLEQSMQVILNKLDATLREALEIVIPMLSEEHAATLRELLDGGPVTPSASRLEAVWNELDLLEAILAETMAPALNDHRAWDDAGAP